MRHHLWPIVLFVAVGASAGEAKRPDVGSVAPDFSAQGTNGKTVKLSDYKGKQTVVLAFFVKVFTGG
jgi:thioredoxin-dependent peroxiredoxin